MKGKSINCLLTGITLVSSGSFFSSNSAEAHSFDYCIDILQEEAETSVTGTSNWDLEQKDPKDYQAFSQDCEQELKDQGFITISQVKADKKLAESVRDGIVHLDSLDSVKVQQGREELKQREENLSLRRQETCAKRDPATDFACRPQQRREEQLEPLEKQKIDNLQSAPPQANGVLVAALPQVSDMLSQWTSKILQPVSPLVSLITGNWEDQTRDPSAPASADLVAQAGPSSDGTWNKVFAWPLVAIHMAVLPNKKVLAWTRPKLTAKPNTPQYTVWNPALGTGKNAFTYPPAFGEPGALATDIFCAGHDFAPSGNLLVVGGHESQTAGDGSRNINVYNLSTGKWTPFIGAMAVGRWYPTVTYNGNGEGVIVGGSIESEDKSLNGIPEVWGRNGSLQTTRLTGANLKLPVKPYVWNFLSPSGRIFNAGPTQTTRVLDTNTPGKWIPVSQNDFGDRLYGTAVMYDGDNSRVLIVGGSPRPFGQGSEPTNTAEVIDLSKSNDWVETGRMAFPRRHHTATLLPDGKVFVVGGTTLGDFNNPNGRPRQGEIWDPATMKWDTVASMAVERSYHTTAVLLPDATVLVAGGGLPAANAKDEDAPDRTQGNYNAEIYRPPYLSNGAQPRIDPSFLSVNYGGKPFQVKTLDANSIEKVHLIRLSSMTHQFNMGQRLNRLNFTKVSDGSGLNVTVPTDKNKTPPGYYMLFILNDKGVPSVAKMIRIS